MEALISVIVPIYNTEQYLEKCIESIVRQTYHNWELLLVDDGSTDHSREICLQYCNTDSRIHYIYQENRGVSAARNKGIRSATGNYIYFMDSDDTIKDELLEIGVRYMENEKLDLLYFNAALAECPEEEYWNPDVVVGDYKISEYRQKQAFIINDFFSFNLKYSIWNKIYDASIIRRKSLFFDEGIKIGEDIGFNIKYLLIANRVKGIDDELYLYWYREDSAMSYDGKQVFWIKEFSQMMENIKKIYMETDFPRKGFRSIFIMAMDNQYKKRMDRSQFKPFVKQVENRKFLIKETIDVILHPRDFIQIYGNPEAKRKWKDHLYILKYLFFLRTRGI